MHHPAGRRCRWQDLDGSAQVRQPSRQDVAHPRQAARIIGTAIDIHQRRQVAHKIRLAALRRAKQGLIRLHRGAAQPRPQRFC